MVKVSKSRSDTNSMRFDVDLVRSDADLVRYDANVAVHQRSETTVAKVNRRDNGGNFVNI